MNKRYSFIILIAISRICYAQNLVPNPSFETMIACPPSISGACNLFNDVLGASCANWHNAGCGSADYFNSCNDTINGMVSIPNNSFGFQNARTGSAYLGLVVQQVSSFCLRYREYATSMLNDTLTANISYYVEFYTSPADAHASFGIDSTDALGALFTVGEPDTTGTNGACWPLQYAAQVNNPDGYFIIDTLGWTKISGTFVANGGENYITLGDFKDTSLTHGSRSYYYIDDVLVIADSLVNTQEYYHDKIISINPNPFTNSLNVSVNSNLKSRINIYDITSRIIIHGEFIRSVFLNTEQLARGIYIYEVSIGDNMSKKGKIVKN